MTKASSTKPKVLLVDDEPAVLAGLRLHLRKDCDVTLAGSGAQALERLAEDEFAVVVSDMRMPEMSGAELLSRVAREHSGSVRILLTGYADLDSAILAVNEGHVFRFLSKPCPPPALRTAVMDGIEQHRLLSAERDLLEDTLHGSVKVLTEVLGLVNAVAFNQAGRLHELVAHACRQIEIEEPWRFEVAALLSQLGCVTLPLDLVERAHSGTPLDEEDETTFGGHPAIGRDLLASIPRLETTGEMIASQQDVPDVDTLPDDLADWEPALLGGQLLRTATALERLIRRTKDPGAALAELIDDPSFASPVVEAFRNVDIDSEGLVPTSLDIAELAPSMRLLQDVKACNGTLLARQDSRITAALLQLLRNFDEGAGVEQPILVLAPVGTTESRDGEPELAKASQP